LSLCTLVVSLSNHEPTSPFDELRANGVQSRTLTRLTV